MYIVRQLRFYHKNVHEHFFNPKNVGSLNINDKNVGTAIVGKASCGDVLKLQIKVDENNKIIDTKFKAFGCGSAIASASLTTELIKNKDINEIIHIKNTDISKYLKLPPIKIHCSILAEEAIKNAIKDYKNKNLIKDYK